MNSEGCTDIPGRLIHRLAPFISAPTTKVKANASKPKAMSYERMNETEQRLQPEVEELLRRAAAVIVGRVARRRRLDHGKRAQFEPERQPAFHQRGAHLSGARGNKAIAAMIKSSAHQEAIAGGIAHFTGLPYIELDGDRAVVTSYLQILTPRKSGERNASSDP